jgi:hypothetical protein
VRGVSGVPPGVKFVADEFAPCREYLAVARSVHATLRLEFYSSHWVLWTPQRHVLSGTSIVESILRAFNI